ncbi:hypothetical protein EMIT0194MI4_40488 [Pseudomonas sp. IT-194MI4]
MRFWLEVAFLFCGCGQLRVTLSGELATLSGSGLVLRMAHKHWVRGRQSLMVAIDPKLPVAKPQASRSKGYRKYSRLLWERAYRSAAPPRTRAKPLPSNTMPETAFRM